MSSGSWAPRQSCRPTGRRRCSAQQSGKVPRIGYLSPRPGLSARDEAFLQGLRDLGYVEGEDIVIEYRFAEGEFQRLTELAAELVELEVDILVAVVTQASLAAKESTSTIPIVMIAVSDPVGSGLVASLARPGGNITGTSSMNAEVIGKSLELLREAVPTTTRVAVLWNPSNKVFQAQLLRQVETAAASLAVQLSSFAVRNPDEFEQVFAAIANESVDALLVLPDPVLIVHQGLIVGFAESSRLPTMFGVKESAAAGGLMAYGPKMDEQFRRSTSHVDKIIKGDRPGDLPVEQPTEFELTINLKAAKALDLTLPPSLLARADEVIE